MKSGSLIWSLCHEDFSYEHVLVGTAHLGEVRTIPILDRAYQLLERASVFYAESDLTTLSELGMPSMSADLKELMSSRHYNKARRIVWKTFKVDIESMRHVPPLITLQICAARTLVTTLPSIDQCLWQRSMQLGIPCHGLESAVEQQSIMNAIPLKWQIKQFRDSLANVAKFKKGIEKMLNAYQQEDMQLLYRLSREGLGSMRGLLLDDRNERLADRMVSIMAAGQNPIFFSMGAAHLGGYHGVLRKLKLRGYTIKAL